MNNNTENNNSAFQKNPNNNRSPAKPQNNPSPQRSVSGNKKMVAIMVGIAALFTLGGVMAFVLLSDTGTYVLGDTIEGLREVDSFEYSGALNLSIENINSDQDGASSEFGEDVSFSLDLEGAVDAQDKENINQYSKFDATIGMGAQGFGMDLAVAGELRVLGEEAYLYMEEIPFFLDMFGFGLAQGQWINLDLGDFQNNFTENDEEILQAEKQAEVLIDLTDEHPPLKNLNKTRDENINGVSVDVYETSLDKENILMVTEMFHEKMREEFPENNTAEFGEEDLEELEKTLNDITHEKIELWIGENDNLPYRIINEMTIEDEESKTEYDLDLSLKNFNDPVEIEVPEDAKSMEEIMQEQQEEVLRGFEHDFEMEVYNEGFEQEGDMFFNYIQYIEGLHAIAYIDTQQTTGFTKITDLMEKMRAEISR